MSCCLPLDLFLRKGDFSSPNSYQNKIMKGMRFRVLLDRHIVLEPGIEWEVLTSGGFQILISGWEIGDDTVMVIEFY